MKRLPLIFILIAIPALCLADVGFIVGAKGCTWISPDLEGFKAEKNNIGFLAQDETVEVVSPASSGAIVLAGLALDTGILSIHVTGGAGYLFNNAFRIGVLTAEADALLKLGSRFIIGPRAGIAFYDPDWIAEEGEVTITSDDPGALLGFSGCYLWSKVKLGASVDYQTGVFDVESDDGWHVNDDELDMSGVAIRLGVATSFRLFGH